MKTNLKNFPDIKLPNSTDLNFYYQQAKEARVWKENLERELKAKLSASKDTVEINCKDRNTILNTWLNVAESYAIQKFIKELLGEDSPV